MNEGEKTITVYGIFDDDRCIYIGRTLNFPKRMRGHKILARHRFSGLPSVRALKIVSQNLGHETEHSLIHKYASVGQADYNKNGSFLTIKKRHPGSGSHKMKILAGDIPEILERFDSGETLDQIGKSFGVTRERIRQITVIFQRPARRQKIMQCAKEKRESLNKLRQEKWQRKMARLEAASKVWKRGGDSVEVARLLRPSIKKIERAVSVISIYRSQFPNLFPYRMPKHKNMRE